MKKILLILSLFVCAAMVQAKDLEVTGKHKVKQTIGLTLISKDDLWADLRLSSKSESCTISVRDVPIRGDRFITNDCIFITNSKNVDLVCTKNKSMCKTEVEVENYVESYGAQALNKQGFNTQQKMSLPFIGKARFNFSGGFGTQEYIVIKENGDTEIGMCGNSGCSASYTGKFKKIIEGYAFSPTTVSMVSKSGSIVKTCNESGILVDEDHSCTQSLYFD